MKKRRLYTLAACTLACLGLASCTNSTVRNTSIPFGNIDKTTTIATSYDSSVNNELYYNKLRAAGYDTIFREIKTNLFQNEVNVVKSQINLNDSEVTKHEQEIFDSYATALFGSSDKETIEDLTSEELNKKIQQYIDNSSNQGIFITTEQCKSYTFTADKIQFSYIPQEYIDEQVVNLAINDATKDALDKIVDEERIPDEKDETKLVANTNYISEDDIINYYESNNMNYGTYSAIIIQFNNLTEARNAINSITNTLGELTEENALEFYVELYNTYYNYRTPLDINNPFVDSNDSSKTIFTYNEDLDELSEISSSIKNILTTTLEEDGQFILKPFNQKNKYVMVYRGPTVFEVNEKYNFEIKNELLEWKDLQENSTAVKELKTQIREKLIENKISSYTTTVINNRIESADIKIYDPYFEYKFKNAYDDYYELISPSDFDNNNIFKITIDGNEYTYSVNNFYNTQSKKSGMGIIVDQLSLDYVYQYKNKFLTNDEINDYQASFDEEIKAFNNNKNTTYPKELGFETFLLGTYGYTNKDDAFKYGVIASSVLTSYLNQTIFDEWAKLNADGTYSHEIDETKLNALYNILDKGNKNYSNLFSINIDHMLIFIDDNADGNPDDPKDFLKNYNEQQIAEYNNALLELSQAIYNEANCEELTKENSLMEILEYIVKAYSKNEHLFSDPTKTWADYKKYNFQLKVESLSSNGDTTQSNVSNYVKKFADYVKELYNKAKENDLEIKEDESLFYFVNSLDKAPSSIDDLCSTEFGYHMIVVNEYDSPSTTKNLESSDTNGYQKDIEILLNENDDEDTKDNIYVIVPNTYNDKENEATIYQLFTYYVQLKNGSTSTFDSTLRGVLSSMFDEAINKFTSSKFQSFLLFKDLQISVTDSDSTLFTQISNYEGYLIRTLKEYEETTDFDDWYTGNLDWSRPYNE